MDGVAASSLGLQGWQVARGRCCCCAVADLEGCVHTNLTPSRQPGGTVPNFLLLAALLGSWKGSWEALCFISGTGGAGKLRVTKSCSKT